MKPNKSIDGLVTHEAKVAKKHPTNAKKVKVTPKPSTKQPVAKLSDTPIVDSKSQKSPSRDAALEDFLNPTKTFDFNSESGELEAVKNPPVNKKDTNMPRTTEDPHKSPKHKKKPSKARLIITGILLVLVVGLICGVLWVVFWGNDIIAKITGGRGNVFDALTFMDENYDPLKTDANGRTSILAFGTSGYDMSGDEGDGVHDGAQLTDSIMAISLNQDTGDIVMISLPRDLKASPTCTATGKINEVYWCNNMQGDDEEAGATALMEEVGDILGMEFQYYAHLNWGSLVSIVDTLGGITVTLDEDIDDSWWTGAVYEAGVPYTINGEEALGLARARHGTAGGDFSRGASQQKILIGIKDKIFEKNLSITDIIGLASALGDNLRTNFSLPEMKSLAHLTFNFDFDTIRQVSLLDYNNNIYYMTMGTLDNGISYVFPAAGVGNYSEIQEYIDTQLSNDPLVYESPSVLILNASDEPSLASTEKSKLESLGYQNVSADNATDGTYPSGTTLYVIANNKPGTRALLEDRYGTATTTLPDTTPQEYDFVILLNPATNTPSADN